MRIDWVPFSASALVAGATALAVFTIGCVGTAGFAMVLAFFRAMVLTDDVDPAVFDEVVREPGLAVLLYGWIAAFYFGELLLGIALLMAKTTPTWVPILLLVHAATFPLRAITPDSVQPFTALLVTVALAGVGISANNRNAAVLPRG